ncbi:ATP-binding protein [Streptomyces sp. NBC_01262]|uniref:ATP-binding protein n=1 Tax=Streptomyces sp. NBC_01262 TaxID=2903803 RepID=UPI002E3581AE|nr:ATP-binding protein [Streptomyces sp. NBC_01262]
MQTRAPDQASVTVRTFTQHFSSTRKGARLARLLTLHQLDEWGIGYDSTESDAAGAIVAELAANAATHGRVPGRDFEVSLMLGEAQLRIEVADARGERRPAVPAVPGRPEGETGRGLLVVEVMADRWGVRGRSGPGKTVWAEVDLPGAGPACCRQRVQAGESAGGAGLGCQEEESASGSQKGTSRP